MKQLQTGLVREGEYLPPQLQRVRRKSQDLRERGKCAVNGANENHKILEENPRHICEATFNNVSKFSNTNVKEPSPTGSGKCGRRV